MDRFSVDRSRRISLTLGPDATVPFSVATSLFLRTCLSDVVRAAGVGDAAVAGVPVLVWRDGVAVDVVTLLAAGAGETTGSRVGSRDVFGGCSTGDVVTLDFDESSTTTADLTSADTVCVIGGATFTALVSLSDALLTTVAGETTTDGAAAVTGDVAADTLGDAATAAASGDVTVAAAATDGDVWPDRTTDRGIDRRSAGVGLTVVVVGVAAGAAAGVEAATAALAWTGSWAADTMSTPPADLSTSGDFASLTVAVETGSGDFTTISSFLFILFVSSSSDFCFALGPTSTAADGVGDFTAASIFMTSGSADLVGFSSFVFTLTSAPFCRSSDGAAAACTGLLVGETSTLRVFDLFSASNISISGLTDLMSVCDWSATEIGFVGETDLAFAVGAAAAAAAAAVTLIGLGSRGGVGATLTLIFPSTDPRLTGSGAVPFVSVDPSGLDAAT